MSGHVGENFFGEVGQHGVVRQAVVTEVRDEDGKVVWDEARSVPAKLTDKAPVPPFGVINQASATHQARKAAWIAEGIQSEIGRSARTYNFQEWDEQKNGSSTMDSDQSIFDPVVCEVVPTWFCLPGGLILDPFAGGSVRGIVAAKLGFRYQGIDLSERQVEANREQATAIVPDNQPTWVVGDARQIRRKGYPFDFLFSCPPYSCLEVYSDDPADLSQIAKRKGYDAFLEAYRDIISICAGRLADDRFACFVVGNFRDSEGHLVDFVGDTVRAFEDAGMRYYNDAILLSPVGTGRLRAGQFDKSRKLIRLHQYVLVFVKGSWKKAIEVIRGESDVV